MRYRLKLLESAAVSIAKLNLHSSSLRITNDLI